MKRTARICIILLLVLLLAGCTGGNRTEQPEATAAESVQETAAPETPTDEPEEEPAAEAAEEAAIAAAENELRTEPLPPPLVYGTGPEDYGMILNLEERSQAMNDEEIWDSFEQLSMLDYYRAAFDETPREIEPRSVVAALNALVN